MTDLTPAQTNWYKQAAALEEELAAWRQALIDAESDLADRLLGINTFEFKLRLRVGNLVRRIDELAAEIQTIRQKLRQRDEAWADKFDGESNGRTPFDTEGAAAAGDYRYRDGDAPPPEMPPLDADTSTKLKQLYRQLAFRFHPDMAVDDADRQYRTQMMMAINAAYAASDLDKLTQLATEPDSSGHLDMSNITAELVATLQRELERVKRRLAEIEEELDRLSRHPNVRMMRDTERAAAEGIDLMNSYEAQLRRQIARKLVERDSLQQQLEDLDDPDAYHGEEDIADTMYNLNLEQAFEDDPDLDVDDIMARRRDRYRGFQSEDDDVLDADNY